MAPMPLEGVAPMPLEGVTVLDCTQVMAGPFCTMLLADMGADVIKVEKPGGDDSRRMGPPFINGESAAFLGINRNKQSIVLDLRNGVDRSVLRRIASQADVVAENFRPGTMDRLGLGPDELRAEHPELIWVSISGFGQTGPYASRPGYDLLAQGMSGMMSVTGYPGSPPVKVSIPLADLSAGMFRRQRRARRVHPPAQDRRGAGHRHLAAGGRHRPHRLGGRRVLGLRRRARPKGSAHRLVAPYQAMESADGYFNIGVANQANYERLCAALERPDLLTDPRFASNPDRVRHYEALPRRSSARRAPAPLASGWPCSRPQVSLRGPSTAWTRFSRTSRSSPAT